MTSIIMKTNSCGLFKKVGILLLEGKGTKYTDKELKMNNP